MAPRVDRDQLDRWKRSGLRTYNGKWAQTYDSCLFWRFFSQEKWDNLVVERVRTFPTDSPILDVGCATGRLLCALGQAGMTDLSGVDIAQRIITTARNRLGERNISADLRVADAENRLPWPDRSFDVVTLTGVLHHFSHPVEAMGEVRRVLRDRGQLIVTEPRFCTPIRQLANMFLRVFPCNGDYSFYSPQRARLLLEETRFRVLLCQRATWSIFLMVGQKA